MAEAQKLRSAKRFGARYGRRIKHKLDEVETILRGEHKCPYCRSMKAKRLATGIWHCKKCCAKFTGKAYDVSKKVIIKEEIEGEEAKEEVEENG